MSPDRGLVSIGNVARLLGVSPSAVVKWERAGRLPTALRVEPGARRVWPRADIEAIAGSEAIQKRDRRVDGPLEAA